MPPERPLHLAEAALHRGDVRSAVPHAAVAHHQSPEEEVRWHLMHAQILLLSGYAADGRARAREALSLVASMDDDALEVQALLLQARISAFLRAHHDVRALLNRAARLAPRGSLAWARVRNRQGMNEMTIPDAARAVERFREALDVFEREGALQEHAHVVLQLAHVAVRSDRPEEAERHLRSCEPHLTAPPLHSWAGAYHTVRAHCAWRRGDIDAAERHLAQASEVYGTLGMTPLQADLAINRAELLRNTGRLQEAREQYLRLSFMRTVDEQGYVSRLNLALVELQLGKADEAARIATGLLHDTDQGMGWLDALLYALTLPALLHDAQRLRDGIRAARSTLEGTDAVHEQDVVMVLSEVGKVLAARGAVTASARLHAMALDHLERLDRLDSDDAAQQRAALAALRHQGARPRLGDVELDDVLGTGGMGIVWRGTDHRTGARVAVKVIRAAHQAPEQAQRAAASLRRELTRVASLSHPAIVDVLDSGEVTASAAALADGQLVIGSPWVTMELVQGGTLRNLRGRVDWPTARTILYDLLDALAHAHARGLVHLDLKAVNVLVHSGTRPPRIQLTDFGVSRGFRERAERPLAEGTPRYMAPEQLQGHWRAVGPWTDLYALGCVATELLCGRPPFKGTVEELVEAHLQEEPPLLRPVCAVPAGLDAWIRRLLCKHPIDRFLRAADARLALEALEDAPLEAPHDRTLPEPEPSWASADTFVLDDVAPDAEAVTQRADDAPPIAERAAPACPAQPPARRPSVRHGLAMLSHRAPLVIGRERVLTTIWTELHLALSSGIARWVELVGPEGTGTEALAREFAMMAHEAGVISAVIMGPGDDLSTVMTHLIGPVSLRGEALRRQLADRGRAWDLDAATLEVLAQSLEQNTVVQHAELWLAAAAAERPLVWLAAEPIAPLRRAMENLRGTEHPFLILSTRDPLGNTAPSLRAPLEVPVEPLADAAMVAGMTVPAMTDDLRWEVAQRVEGCEEAVRPLLLQNAARGLLVEGPEGLQRRADVRAELQLPAAPVWEERAAAWKARVPASVWTTLEWICVAAEPVPVAPLDPDALEAVLREGWVRAVDDKVAPRVTGLRQAVRRAMLAEGRLAPAATVMASWEGWTPHGRAALWQWGGRAEPAEAAYRDALRATDDPVARTVIWRRWERMARQLGLSTEDPRWQEGMALAATPAAAEPG